MHKINPARLGFDFELEYFIDDRAETCLQLEQAVHPIVFTQPWNRGRHSSRSVDSWRQIRELCFAREPAYRLNASNTQGATPCDQLWSQDYDMP